jgi:hypothetical protein
MNNCLRPTGIPYASYRRDLDPDKARLQHPEAIPHSERDPMPAWPGSLIDTVKGVRRILNDELAKGQGMPTGWTGGQYPASNTTRRTPAVHILEYLSGALTSPPAAQVLEPTDDDDAESIPDLIPRHETFTWKPPDLSPTSAWTLERVQHLIMACLEYENPGPMIEQGLMMLRRHRTNYNSEGPIPTNLQLLWWEFPRESWDELRAGCPMNFIRKLIAAITPNSELTPEQAEIAMEFIKELVGLGFWQKSNRERWSQMDRYSAYPSPGNQGNGAFYLICAVADRIR